MPAGALALLIIGSLLTQRLATFLLFQADGRLRNLVPKKIEAKPFTVAVLAACWIHWCPSSLVEPTHFKFTFAGLNNVVHMLIMALLAAGLHYDEITCLASG